MGRRAIARAVITALWWFLIGSVVVVYAYLAIAVMDSIFGPARDLFAALNGSLPP